ncbi:MAG: hypothetical protein QM498_14325 [Desulfobacterium sp.]
MDKKNKKVQFQIDGLLKIKKVGDYLKLRDKKVKFILKKRDDVLNTKTISSAHVIELSEMATHLILENVCVKKYFLFSQHFGKYNVPINNISAIQILSNHV